MLTTTVSSEAAASTHRYSSSLFLSYFTGFYLSFFLLFSLLRRQINHNKHHNNCDTEVRGQRHRLRLMKRFLLRVEFGPVFDKGRHHCLAAPRTVTIAVNTTVLGVKNVAGVAHRGVYELRRRGREQEPHWKEKKLQREQAAAPGDRVDRIGVLQHAEPAVLNIAPSTELLQHGLQYLDPGWVLAEEGEVVHHGERVKWRDRERLDQGEVAGVCLVESIRDVVDKGVVSGQAIREKLTRLPGVPLRDTRRHRPATLGRLVTGRGGRRVEGRRVAHDAKCGGAPPHPFFLFFSLFFFRLFFAVVVVFRGRGSYSPCFA